MALHMKFTPAEKMELKSNLKMVRNGHAKPKSVAHLHLDRPGRVRVGHLLTLLNISHSTLYERIKRGTWPEPDGKDTRPYWETATVKYLLSFIKGV